MPFAFPDVFSRGKLKTQEAATLLGVTRVTVSSWKNGGNPHTLIKQRVARFVTAVETAVNASELPLHADVRRGDRMKQLYKILRQHLPK